MRIVGWIVGGAAALLLAALVIVVMLIAFVARDVNDRASYCTGADPRVDMLCRRIGENLTPVTFRSGHGLPIKYRQYECTDETVRAVVCSRDSATPELVDALHRELAARPSESVNPDLRRCVDSLRAAFSAQKGAAGSASDGARCR